MTVRSALPLAAFVALLVGISVVLAGAASTIALERGRGGSLDTDLRSLIRADYSATARSQNFAPLNRGVIEVAQQDNQFVPATGEDIEFVPIFRLNPPAAGPDSIMRTGKARAIAGETRPPLDCMIRNS